MKLLDADRWNEIWQTLARNRKRSIVTAFGVFWGVFMLAVLLGAGMGITRLMQSQLGGMSTNTCLIFTDLTSVPYKGFPIGRSWEFDSRDPRRLLQTVPAVRYVAGGNWGGEFDFSRANHKSTCSMIGYTSSYADVLPPRIVTGRYLNQIDDDNRRKVCVIGTQVYKDLFPEGDDPIGQTIMANGIYLTVVGVVGRQGGIIVFSDIERTVSIPLSLCQRLFGQGDRIDFLAVTGHDGHDVEKLENDCKRVLAAAHYISPDDSKAVMAINFGREIKRGEKLFNGIWLLTWIVGLGTLLAGIVGISNIMLVTVRERTQEIGIRRALGAPPRSIISQVLSESFVLTFVAGIAGLALAVALLSVADSLNLVEGGQEAHISWQISFWLGLGCVTIIAAGSILAGIIPASRALNIKAVDAIKEE